MANVEEIRGPAAAAINRGPGETLTERITALLPNFARRADACEANRVVSEETIAELKEAGIMRAYTPKYYGGAEECPHEWSNCLRKIASVCPSTGWVTAVLSAHNFMTAGFNKKAQDEYFDAAGADTMASTAILPTTKCTLVEGGIRVSGRFPYSSGSDHAQWAQIALLMPDISQREPEEAPHIPILAMIPRSEYELDDTWHVLGLRGTGSKDMIMKDVFVPHYRVELMGALAGGWSRGKGIHEGWVWNVPFVGVMGSALPAATLGMAEGLVREMKKRLQTRTHPGTNMPMDSVPSYMRYAESTHQLMTIDAYWNTCMAGISARAKENIQPDEDTAMATHSGFIYCQHAAGEIIDRLFKVAGATCIRDENVVQRFWRDTHAAMAHFGADYDAAAQTYGRHLLDLSFIPRAM